LIVDEECLFGSNRIEVIAGVEGRVSKIFERRSVKLVRAGFCDDVDNSAAVAPIFRRKLRLDVELPDGIDGQKRGGRARDSDLI
jgi:hypothetical protein